MCDLLHQPSYIYFLGNHELQIDMEDFEGNQRYAKYKNFKVDDEQVTLQHFGDPVGTLALWKRVIRNSRG